jgi:type I restriction-modification system DNA methylase subunit
MAPTKKPKARSSEVDAYLFIKDNLRLLGWDIRNPARHPSGQVFTQSECLADAEIKRCLNLDRPENIIRVSDSVLWVIEAKRHHSQIAQAIAEAEGYSRQLTAGGAVQALFASGVAGNDIDSYLVQTKFFVKGKFRPITFNGKAISSLISPEVAKTVLRDGPDLNDVPFDEALFVSKAELINQILHLGAINKDYRARVMAALLLALLGDTPPNIDSTPIVLIRDINARAEEVLQRESKQEFFEYVKLSLPSTKDNHIKFKKAIVATIQELQNLNIRSAMNSGTDVLGKFYEVFLKYGNGAKDIGIVLTPRHITRFAADAIGVTDQDIVYDPACGTGGFLVAAFDAVKRSRTTAQVNRFKQNNLFGVDQESPVVSLAIVNMIFRGDGKNNIIEGDAFQKNLVRATRGGHLTAKYSAIPPSADEAVVTRVLMNPPFALKASDEKEYRFIDIALRQMQHGGLLFAVLPYSVLVKGDEAKRWRRRLLEGNSLMAVVTFPPDLFYPVSVHTVGIFLKRGVAHPREQRVLWIRGINDGLLKRKGKRLPNLRAVNDYERITSTVRAFVSDPTLHVDSIVAFQKASPIDYDDPLLELVPENYLDEPPVTNEEIIAGMESVLRDAVGYIMRSGRRHG